MDKTNYKGHFTVTAGKAEKAATILADELNAKPNAQNYDGYYEFEGESKAENLYEDLAHISGIIQAEYSVEDDFEIIFEYYEGLMNSFIAEYEVRMIKDGEFISVEYRNETDLAMDAATFNGCLGMKYVDSETSGIKDMLSFVLKNSEHLPREAWFMRKALDILEGKVESYFDDNTDVAIYARNFLSDYVKENSTEDYIYDSECALDDDSQLPYVFAKGCALLYYKVWHSGATFGAYPGEAKELFKFLATALRNNFVHYDAIKGVNLALWEEMEESIADDLIDFPAFEKKFIEKVTDEAKNPYIRLSLGFEVERLAHTDFIKLFVETYEEFMSGKEFYEVTFEVEGTFTVKVAASSQEEAEAEAFGLLENADFGELEGSDGRIIIINGEPID